MALAAKAVLALLALLWPFNAFGQDIIKEFSDEFAWNDNDIPQFNNLVVDKVTGRVYIGAVNNLYQLSPDLTLTESAVTGN